MATELAAPGTASTAATFSVPISPGDLAKVLVQLHPDIERLLPTLQKYLECYEGDNISAFIFQHLRENTKNHTARRRRAYYYNYCASIIDTYISFLFRKPIVRTIRVKSDVKLKPVISPPPTVVQLNPDPGAASQASPAPTNGAPANPTSPTPTGGLNPQALPEMLDKDFRQFHEDVDLKGTPISDWMKTTALYTQVFGMLGIVIDMPQAPEGMSRDEMSEQDRIDNEILPYATRIFPTSIVNWELDTKGRLLWIRYREDPPSQPNPLRPRDISKQSVWYRTWTRSEWFLHKIEGQNEATLIDSGSHELNKVPFVMVYNKQSLKNQWLGISAISSIANINIGILNWCSLIDEHLYQKCLSILAIKKRIDEEEEITIGNNNILEYTSDKPPEFISPKSEPEKFIQEQIKEAVRQIYRVARMGGATGLQEPREAQSGVAYAFEFNETNNLLADKADLLEQAEREMHWFVGKWLNKDDKILSNIIIDYPEDFGLDDVVGELETLTTVQERMTSDTFKREVQKRLLKRILPKIDKDLLTVMLQEIDLNPPTPPIIASGGGGFGGGASSKDSGSKKRRVGPIDSGGAPGRTGEESGAV